VRRQQCGQSDHFSLQKSPLGATDRDETLAPSKSASPTSAYCGTCTPMMQTPHHPAPLRLARQLPSLCPTPNTQIVAVQEATCKAEPPFFPTCRQQPPPPGLLLAWKGPTQLGRPRGECAGRKSPRKKVCPPPPAGVKRGASGGVVGALGAEHRPPPEQPPRPFTTRGQSAAPASPSLGLVCSKACFCGVPSHPSRLTHYQ